MASKRLSFRFLCKQYPVKYKTAYLDGEGKLHNISTGGCAFFDLTQPLDVDEKILISIDLGATNTTFEAQGRVVRFEGGMVAVQYILIEPESERLIRDYFSSKLRKSRS